MFHTLTKSFNKIFDSIRSTGSLTESQIDNTMRDIRIALLEADVALPVVKDFIASVKIKAIGQEIIRSVSPAQMLIKIIHDEMVAILAADSLDSALNLNAQPPINILLVGLQGSGKTTASAKLALKLKNQNKKVLLVSLDIYRPAAKEQLLKLAITAGVNSLEIKENESAIDIAKRAKKEGALSSYDVVIYDSAGRLHIDDIMMEEILQIQNFLNPSETLLVIDSMTGQSALNIASEFDSKLQITGTILSRIDGDSKGGAAFSVKHITKKPIKFLSAGENLSSLEEFNPERLASRILDMGDIVAFVQNAAENVDKDEAERAARRMQKGIFNFNDYLSQIRNIKKLGGFSSILNMLPGAGRIKEQINDISSSEKLLKHQEAIILSMTKKERRNPDIMNGSRRKRVALGSGVSVQQVNILLKQFKEMSTMLKKTSKMDKKTLARSTLGKFFS